MMLSLVLAATWASLDGGSSRQFTALLGDFPAGQVAESVTDTDTPGSTNWYRRVETVRVPSAWDSPTNEPPPRIDFIPLTSRQPVGDYNLQVTTPDGEESPFYEGQFDALWQGGYAMATNYIDFSCVDNYGFPLYRYMSHKLDKRLYGAYFAAYNAYWERLYYGGQCAGVVIKWDGEDMPERFMMDPRHYFVRSGMAEDYHRLLEHTNIVSFAKHANEMFASLYMYIPTTSATEQNRNHPAFAYRPGWIADNACSFGNAAHLYWASTMPPPLVPQDLGGGITVTPSHLGDILLPGFNWREEAITRKVELSDVESEVWQYCAINLAGLFSGETHPIRCLFENVGIAPTAGDPAYIRNYRLAGDPRYDFMTNTYQFAGRACAHHEASEDEYFKCFGGYASSRKNLPGAFVGFNQMLAVMNRLIYVPTVDMRYYNQNWTNSNQGAYVAHPDDTYEFSVKWDEDKHRYVVTNVSESANIKVMLSNRHSSRGKSGSPVIMDWMDLCIGKVTQPDSRDLSAGGVSASIAIDGYDSEQMFAECGAEDYFEITGVTPLVDVIKVDFHSDTSLWTHVHTLYGREATGDLVFRPHVFVKCDYQTVEPLLDPWIYRCNKHVHGSGDKMNGAEVAFLDKREWKYAPRGTADFITQYKSLGTEATSAQWEDMEYNHGLAMQEDMIADAEAHTGRFMNPSLFAPLPPEAYFKYNGSAFECDDDGRCDSNLQFKYSHYEDIYDCTMPYALDGTVVITNDVTRRQTDTIYNMWSVYERFEETEDGQWIFTSAVTNYDGNNYYEGDPFVWTNLLSRTLVGGTNDYKVVFPVRCRDEIQFDEPSSMGTNTYNEIDEVIFRHAEHSYSIYRTEVYRSGVERTEFDRRELTEEEWDPWFDSREEVVSQSSSNRVQLTGVEVIDLSTNVLERGVLTEVQTQYRVYRDYRWECHYPDPYVSTNELVAQSGELPLWVGVYHVDVHADPSNAVEFTTGPVGFQGEYENKVKFAPIEAVNFDWSSMRLKEYQKEN